MSLSSISYHWVAAPGHDCVTLGQGRSYYSESKLSASSIWMIIAHYTKKSVFLWPPIVYLWQFKKTINLYRWYKCICPVYVGTSVLTLQIVSNTWLVLGAFCLPFLTYRSYSCYCHVLEWQSFPILEETEPKLLPNLQFLIRHREASWRSPDNACPPRSS